MPLETPAAAFAAQSSHRPKPALQTVRETAVALGVITPDQSQFLDRCEDFNMFKRFARLTKRGVDANSAELLVQWEEYNSRLGWHLTTSREHRVSAFRRAVEARASFALDDEEIKFLKTILPTQSW